MATALLSVSDKRGLIPFAESLVGSGYDLVSTGGTFRALQEAGVSVGKVADVTGAAEILGGRVKTLHPKVHGGILAKRTAEHLGELESQGIALIDVVVVNLYPFRETVARGAAEDEVIENIDIGGPTLLRAAAKNYTDVVVVCDPDDYKEVAAALEQGVSAELRRRLGRKAFAHTAAYDAAIVTWWDREERLPPSLHLALERAAPLRYGENPHQQGARYRVRGQPSGWDEAVQLGGLPLSYLNLFDAEAAWRLVNEFEQAAAVIVKHANPCGVAVAESIEAAYERAFAGDPKSAFGGIVALNRPVAKGLGDSLLQNPKADVLLAPGYAPEALKGFERKRKSMRVLELSAPAPAELELRSLGEDFLVQNVDAVKLERGAWQVVTERAPSEAEWRDLELAWLVCAYTKSNAIVLTKDAQVVGVGAGQQSRVDAAELAAKKAAGRARGGASASDAFYPFRDGLEAAGAAGVGAVIQPGGSIRDAELIDAANDLGLAMVMTGERHFRH